MSITDRLSNSAKKISNPLPGLTPGTALRAVGSGIMIACITPIMSHNICTFKAALQDLDLIRIDHSLYHVYTVTVYFRPRELHYK